MGKAELRLEIDELLLQQARSADVHIALVLERALKEALGPEAADARARKWAEDNATALKAYEERIEREGCFGEEWRNW